MSTNGMAVYCKGVTKTYITGSTKVLALRGIDLDVRVGELLMLVGPSGCGKTTLISVIAGILDHDEGECLVFRQNVRAMGQTQKTRYRGANIGFVFQAYNLIPTLSVIENVAVPLLILGRRRVEACSRAREMLVHVGLEDKLNVLPAELSGGECLRVAVARALVNRPRLLLADEPTGSLDERSARELAELLVEVNREEGTSLVVVTHSAALAALMGRRLELHGGVLAG